MRGDRGRPISVFGRAAAALAVAGLTVAGCTSGGLGSPDTHRGSRSGSPSAPGSPFDAGSPSASTSQPAAEPVRLQITPATGDRAVRPDHAVTVVAVGGTLTSVSVRGAGAELPGRFDAQRQRWTSASALHVASRYTVTATGTSEAGPVVTTTSVFRTLSPVQTLRAEVAENAGATYGVGMPIQVSFNRPIADKATVERALHVTTSQPVVGAWYWTDDQDVTFRPRDYWPAHTTVTVRAALNGVRAAAGLYGRADVTRSFRIGTSLIVTASTATHRLHLYRDGKLLHNWPISTGKPGDDTPNGTYLTIEKASPVRMRPADIAPGQPGYYDLEVPWSVRITWSGIYLHDAWWSVDQQGHINVSHGCVNLPPAAAESYYKMSVPGDPVTITGSPVSGNSGDGWTDWFHSWTYLLAHSALHEAVMAGPAGSRFVLSSAVPASIATAPLGRPVPGNSAS
ncbi:MAG: Ig-like domain-containing protein [Jatrophihabitans sp.]|uniref:L,D-transpeptidase n=1 Tax=Jatrophihabitans sp. TaxID=1932789 RepID=UPI00391163A5